ncbi:MAG: ParB/RepB/Spo0J family partition protein [Patescibacteria group bacterium]
MSQFYNDSIFWIEVDKIKPNPYQPRKDFDPIALQALSDSIRQYGVLQALVVTRTEVQKPDGGLSTEYELIAGERRLRASKLAGIREVPCLIKTGEDNNLMKLELAIIENVQREDLNPVDRARSFQRLADEFGFKHAEIGEKIGKSREYVSNSLRLLSLPEDILNALSTGKITEGHARPLMMLNDRPEEQSTLFKEIMFRKLTVREAEMIARKIAVEKVRKKDLGADPEITEIEERFAESLGTRVHIERKEVGGKLTIDFFSKDDLRAILDLVNKSREAGVQPGMMNNFINAQQQQQATQMQNVGITVAAVETVAQAEPALPQTVLETSDAPMIPADAASTSEGAIDDRTPVEKKEEENEDIYSVSNFNI